MNIRVTKKSFRVWTAAMIVGAATMAGCSSTSGDAETQAKAKLEIAEVKVSKSLKAKADRADETLTISNGKPEGTYFAALVAKPGESRQVTIWEGKDKQKTVIPVSAPDSLLGAAEGDTAFVAGMHWSQPGVAEGFLLTREGAGKWNQDSIEIPKGYTSLDAMTISEGTPAFVWTNPDGGVAVQLQGKDAVALPATAKGATTDWIAGVASHGNTIVVIRQDGARGGQSTPISVVSTDRGATWKAGNPLGPQGTDVTQLQWTGKTFLATGQSNAENSTLRAWSSDNGARFTPEKLSGLEAIGPFADTPWRFTGLVNEAGAGSLASYTCQDCTSGYLATRTASGKWSYKQTGDPGEDSDPSNTFVPGQFGPAEARLNDATGQFDGPYGVMVEGAEQATLSTPMLLGDSTLIAGNVRDFKRQGDGWYRNYLTAPYVYSSENGIVKQAWPANATKNYSIRDVAQSREISAMVGSLMSNADDRQWKAVGLYSTSPNKWSSIKNLAVDGYSTPQAAIAIKKQLFVALATGTSGSDDTRPTTIRTSTNGTKWTTEKGVWSRNGRSSTISKFCSTSKGPVAVGSMDRSDGQGYDATVWRRVKSEWKKVTLAQSGPYSSFDNCYVNNGKTFVTGMSNGRDTEWVLDSSGKPTSPKKSPLNESRGTVYSLGSLEIAAGWLKEGRLSSPVLWYRKPGEAWASTPIPQVGIDGLSSVSPVGKDVLIITNQAGGAKAWKIPDAEAQLMKLNS